MKYSISVSKICIPWKKLPSWNYLKILYIYIQIICLIWLQFITHILSIKMFTIKMLYILNTYIWNIYLYCNVRILYHIINLMVQNVHTWRNEFHWYYFSQFLILYNLLLVYIRRRMNSISILLWFRPQSQYNLNWSIFLSASISGIKKAGYPVLLLFSNVWRNLPTSAGFHIVKW